MYGLGFVRGLSTTFRHFIRSYTAEFSISGENHFNQETLKKRQSLKTEGIITVMYPDEKLEAPERFRFVPFLVMDDPAPGQKAGKDWCTACGICAKVCPPQCIWIERGKQPNGRPKSEPANFYIDIDICMNCGYCAEYCPFDAIKMDHDFELASYDRSSSHIHDKERLSKPISYWRAIAPDKAAGEEQARIEADKAKSKKKGARN